MYCSSKFSLSKDAKVEYRPVGLQEIQVGVTALDVALHIATNNFAPNEYREVVNPSGLAVYKGSTQDIMIVATESKDRK